MHDWTSCAEDPYRGRVIGAAWPARQRYQGPRPACPPDHTEPAPIGDICATATSGRAHERPQRESSMADFFRPARWKARATIRCVDRTQTASTFRESAAMPTVGCSSQRCVTDATE